MRISIALAVAALAIAGCGGGGDKSNSTSTSSPATSTTGGTPISAANYKTVLKQVVTQIQSLTSAGLPAGASPDQQVKFAQTVENAVRQARDQLAALRPAGRLADANRVLVDAFGKYADLLGQLGDAAKTQDKAAVARVNAAIRAETTSLQAALAQAKAGG